MVGLSNGDITIRCVSPKSAAEIDWRHSDQPQTENIFYVVEDKNTKNIDVALRDGEIKL